MPALVHRCIVMIIHKYKGGLAHRFTCTQVHGYYTGTLVYQYTNYDSYPPPSKGKIVNSGMTRGPRIQLRDKKIIPYFEWGVPGLTATTTTEICIL